MHLTDQELNEYLDEESADRARMDTHLAVCPDCAARLNALASLFAEIESLPERQLSRDLSAAFLRDHESAALPASRFDALPRWFLLTAVLQAAFGLLAMIIAAPLAVTSLPLLETPSITTWLGELQMLMTTWLESVTALQMPGMPDLPAMEVSAVLLALGGAAAVWLVGNGLILRNQNR